MKRHAAALKEKSHPQTVLIILHHHPLFSGFNYLTIGHEANAREAEK